MAGNILCICQIMHKILPSPHAATENANKQTKCDTEKIKMKII